MIELYLGTFDNFKFTIPRDGDFFSVSREFKPNNEFELFKSRGIMNVKFSIVKLDGVINISIDRIYFSNLIPISNDGSTICWISSLVDPFCLTKDFIARLKLGGVSTISPSSLNKGNILLPNAYRFTLSNNIFSHNDILNNVRGSYILRLKFNADNTISVLPVIHTISRNSRTKDIEVQNWGLSYYKDDITGNDDTYLGNKYLACLHDIIISNLDLESIDKEKLKTSIISNINYK